MTFARCAGVPAMLCPVLLCALPFFLLVMTHPLHAADDTPRAPSLQEAYADHFLVGAALGRKVLTGKDEKAANLVRQQFNLISPENALKWQPLQPEEGRFTFAQADAFVDLGLKHKKAVHGHVLVWHNQTPDWVFAGDDDEPATRDVLLARMKKHIETVAGRYRGKIASWDVVNEALLDDGSLRDSPWRQIIGDDFIEMAFRYAQAAAPEAKLVYNDYNLNLPRKREGALRIVRQLKQKGLRIDRVGMQGHWGLKRPGIEQIEASLIAFQKAGVKVVISELDIDVLPAAWKYRGADITKRFDLQEGLDPYVDGLPDEMQRQLAERYAGIFRLFLKYRDTIDAVTFWGVSDGHSWKNHFPVKGRTNHPLLFDRSCRPKPAFHAVLDEVDLLK